MYGSTSVARFFLVKSDILDFFVKKAEGFGGGKGINVTHLMRNDVT